MNVKQLKQELTTRGVPTDGLKPALVKRLEQAIQHEAEEEKKNSNEAFRSVYAAGAPAQESNGERARGRRA